MYEVWEGEGGGWEAAAAHVVDDHLVLDLIVRTQQTGAPWDAVKGEYAYAEISEQQIREALGCQGEQIEIDGHDVYVSVARRKDGYPIGELHCLSHESLSPIRAFDTQPEDGLWEDWQQRVNATLRGGDK